MANLNPSTTTGYWVRVTSGCAQAESDIALVIPLEAPTSFEANSIGAGAIQLSWDAVAGTTSYVIDRKIGTGSWQTLPGSVTGTSYTDTGVPSTSAALYRVRARVNETESDPSNVDFAHTRTFTDPTILQTITAVKALHLTELRALLNQITDAAGQMRRYTDAEVLPSALQGLAVDDSHFTGLMQKINDVRDDIGLLPAAFNIPPAANALIRKSQIDDLRFALR